MGILIPIKKKKKIIFVNTLTQRICGIENLKQIN